MLRRTVGPIEVLSAYAARKAGRRMVAHNLRNHIVPALERIAHSRRPREPGGLEWMLGTGALGARPTASPRKCCSSSNSNRGCPTNSQSKGPAFPSPNSWESAIKIVKRCNQRRPEIERTLSRATVRETAVPAFSEFLKVLGVSVVFLGQ